jgi:hypothetical protein
LLCTGSDLAGLDQLFFRGFGHLGCPCKSPLASPGPFSRSPEGPFDAAPRSAHHGAVMLVVPLRRKAGLLSPDNRIHSLICNVRNQAAHPRISRINRKIKKLRLPTKRLAQIRRKEFGRGCVVIKRGWPIRNGGCGLAGASLCLLFSNFRFGAHRRAGCDSGVSVTSDCTALRSPWIFATVIVIELARLIWAERIDEPSQANARHLVPGRAVVLRPAGRRSPTIRWHRPTLAQAVAASGPQRRRPSAAEALACVGGAQFRMRHARRDQSFCANIESSAKRRPVLSLRQIGSRAGS